MKPLRFLHIPKTAGSTFTEILQRQYFGKKSFRFTGNIASDIERFRALSKNDRENIVLYTGHAPIATGIREADNAATITFLRDPVNRVKSYCQYVSEGKVPNLIDDFPPDNFHLDSFLESGNMELSNFQATMLINDRLSDSDSFKNISALEAKYAALDNLFNKISNFGIQEYFDESLILFSLAFEWRVPVYVSVNVKNTSKLLRFEKHQLERIAEMNAVDIEIYKLAKERFMHKLDGAEFDKTKLKWFQIINRVYQALEKDTPKPINLSSTIGRVIKPLLFSLIFKSK